MTKMKSKKMTKSTFAIIIMAIAMVAMLAFGGTYAYFTSNVATPLTSGRVTLGTIKLDNSAEATKLTASVRTHALPTETVFTSDASVTIKDASNRTSYIFVEVAVNVYKALTESTWETTADTTANLELTGLAGNFDGTVVDNKGTPEDEDDDVVLAYYILTTEETGAKQMGTAISISGLNITIPQGWNNDYQNAQVEVTFTVKQIQAAGFTGETAAKDAYDAWTASNGTSPVA